MPSAGTGDAEQFAEAVSAEAPAAAVDLAPYGEVLWEALWEALFDQSPVASCLALAPERVIRANQAFLDLHGLDVGELGTIDPPTLAHPDDRPLIVESFRRLLEGEIPSFDVDARIMGRSGNSRWCRIWSTTIRGGPPGLVLSLIADIDNRYRAETARALKEAQLEVVLRHSPDAVVLIGRDGRFRAASTAAGQLVGRPSDELLGSEVWPFVHPDDRNGVREALRWLLEGGPASAPDEAPRQGSLRYRTGPPENPEIAVEAVAAVLPGEDGPAGAVVSIRPYDEDPEVQSAQQVLTRRYQRALENVGERVVLLDDGGRVIEALGRGVLGGGELRTHSLADAFHRCHPDDWDRLSSAFDTLQRTSGATHRDRYRFVHEDGTRMLEFDAANRLDDPDLRAVVLTVRDVTATAEAERAMAEAEQQTLAATTARRDFVATVSHELRTPLHGILGLVELLETSPEDAGEVRQIADLIRRSTEALRSMVDDILDLSKLEAGRLEIVPTTFDARVLGEELHSVFASLAAAKGLTLSTHVDPTLPRWVRGDPLRVRQLVNNLVGNAVRYTDEGSISVRVEVEPSPGARLPTVRLTVDDTGPGIPAEEIGHVFDPFFRGARNTGGSGLGLSIVQRLATAMGGTVGVEPRPGGGSRFWVSLPLVAAPPPAAAALVGDAGDPMIRESRGTQPVLVVEDNHVSRVLAERQLQALGCCVVTVEDGESALALLAELEPAAVLMDLRLPGIDGAAATRALRALEQRAGRRRAPVIVLTASSLAGDLERCLEAGVDSVLTKPIGLGELATALGLDRGHARDPGEASPPTDEAEVVIDAERLRRLTDELGGPETVHELCRVFLDELDERLTAISIAVAAWDPAAIRTACHTLRSASLTIGAVGLAERLRESAQLTPSDLPALRALALGTRRAIEAALGGESPTEPNT